ncbi:hypothetical protein L1787_04190 [Acuticoccus sp. M5D2P5]|uniref:hypothetical protein n=1 Tax=Acuticoccus kalidii TaxID=2910977 RepID=UPI001F25EB70|nr:hypothetical protein [Acuticoccus kalidii]MCF3932616.1 hypothetical protein [Acuticoccus kalidii]
MKQTLERLLTRVFATHAHDRAPESMTAFERREAAHATQPSGTHLETELAEDSDFAREEAVYAMEKRQPQTSELVDDSLVAADEAIEANAHDGAHQRSEPVDDTELAQEEIAFANHHEPPRSELVDGSEEARIAAQRVNEPAPKRQSDPDS